MAEPSGESHEFKRTRKLAGPFDRAPHLDHLDGWRGLAILLLLVGHFAPLPGINFGAVGVQLFFVLSGFLMGGLLFVRQTPLPDFFVRRLSRIVPAHAVFLMVVVLFWMWWGRPVGWRDTLAAMLFLNNYWVDLDGRQAMPFGHVWSLSVEEHSYAVLAALALLSRRLGLPAGRAVALLSVVCAVTAMVYWQHHAGSARLHFLWLHTEVAAYSILVSVLLLLITQLYPVPAVPGWLVLLLMVSALALQWWSVPKPVGLIVGSGLFACSLHLLAAGPEGIRRLLSVRALRQLGVWSFSLYLWQQPFYLAMHKGQLTLWQALPAALLCGIASYYLVERPARAWINRRWASR